MSTQTAPEVAWFGSLCDDDYEFLGVADPNLRSSWEHCRDITLAAQHGGFDNILLPSGYTLGIDATVFAAAIAPMVKSMKLLLALRMGELWLPQLARQIATLDRVLDGRLTINIISSDLPGETMGSEDRYQRTLEHMQGLRALLSGSNLELHGQFLDLEIDPPSISTVSGACPPFYFGGLSESARDVAAAEADVYLLWPDTFEGIAAAVSDVNERAARLGRTLRHGLRAHVIVRETEQEARAAADRLVSHLDPVVGEEIRKRSLDSGSVGVGRQTELRDLADGEGYIDRHLWTGVGRGRSGCGIAVVGDPDQVVETLRKYQQRGIDTFILSGYPHLAECELVSRYVLPALRA
jgi:alkanesulfonate monooxygenase